jgi:hypothetical protein
MEKHEYISSACNHNMTHVCGQMLSVSLARTRSREMLSLICGKARDEYAIMREFKLRHYARDDKVCQVPVTLCPVAIAVIGLTRNSKLLGTQRAPL